MHAIFTIVSSNYLHFARTLFEGMRRHHPDSRRYCVVVDRDTGTARELAEEFEVIELSQLDLPDGDRFLFQYSILELNTAVKPWAVSHLLRKGHATVTYLDPDIFLYAPLLEVERALATGADIIVTPHLLAPISDTRSPGELEIRVSGTYNFGFCAFRESDNTGRFLEWWKSKLMRECVVDTARGIFVDQSWIDLVPGMFENVRILRHQGYNVAYWNIAQRAPEQAASGHWICAGDPLTFFHFSGLNPFDPEPFSKHQNRFTLSTLGAAATLVREYAARLLANGAQRFAGIAYGYATFADGSPIPEVFRRAYRTCDALRNGMGDRPFDRPDFVTERVDAGIDAERRFTYAMWSVHRGRIDLQKAFPLDSDASVQGFFNWFLVEGDKYFSPDTVEAHRAIAATLGIDSRGSSKWRRAVGRLKRYMASDAATGARSPDMAPPTRPEKRAEPVYYAGVHFGDASSAGIWVGRHAVFPLHLAAGTRIAVAGSYPRSLMERHGKVPQATLRLHADTREIVRVTLADEGDFSLDVTIPADANEANALEISCDRHFVPRDLGINQDQRELSWQLKELTAGDLAIVDAQRMPMHLQPAECLPAPGVNLVGYVRAESGVGEGARNFAKAAAAAGVPYSVVDVGFQNPNLQRDDSAMAGATGTDFGIDVLYVNADQTRSTLEHRAAAGGADRAAIAVWHWEQPKLPLRFLDAFDGLTEIWAPSGFVQNAISQIAPIPVFKVPHAISFEVSPQASRRNLGLPEQGFLALVMYDFHSYQYRKNPQAAISAFRAAAANRKDAWLVIKTINSDKHPQELNRLREEVADMRNVVMLDGFMLRQQVYDLEACCDCLISLHRAEGFGLGPAEMMYLGKPVIATGWSANMEFMTPMNSFPIEYELVPLAEPLGVYEAGQPWAEASVDHAADCLRRLIDETGLAGRIGARAAASIKCQLDPAAIGKIYRERLALLRQRIFA